MTKRILTACTALLTTSLSAQVPPAEDMRLYDVSNGTSSQRIGRDIAKLVSFGTRHSLSDTKSKTQGVGAARRWIKAEFEAISKECGGCLEVMTIGDTVSGENRIPDPTEIVSIIAIQRGQHDPNRMVMMSGDIDSRVTDPMNASDTSPGANDNASGMAGVIEAARVLSRYRFSASIVYMGLAGEEQGLFGGKIVAAWAHQQGWNIDAVLNNDMIGNIAGINGVIDNHSARIFSEGVRWVETQEEARKRYFTGGEVDSASRNLARYIKRVGEQYVSNLDLMMVYRLDRFGRGGHHRPFNEAGFPGVRIMEVNEHYDRQHQDLRVEDGRHFGDTIEFVDFDFAAKLTALNAVALAGLAWAPAPPANVEIEGIVQASTSLKWSSSEDGNLAGYRVYWRLTTEPEWTHSRWVGRVDHYTLKNIVIDNYLFGVASVATDGNESPVVFPGPAGAF